MCILGLLLAFIAIFELLQHIFIVHELKGDTLKQYDHHRMIKNKTVLKSCDESVQNFASCPLNPKCHSKVTLVIQ